MTTNTASGTRSSFPSIMALSVGAILASSAATPMYLGTQPYIGIEITTNSVSSSGLIYISDDAIDLNIAHALYQVVQKMQSSSINMDSDLLNDVHANIWSLI